MKALLATVGTGKGVHEAIARSIAAQQPEVLVLLVSETSKAMLLLVADYLEQELQEPLLAARCRGEGGGCELIQLSNTQSEQLDTCYRLLRNGMRRMAQQQGVDWRVSAVDFTSGTKVMSAAAVLAAKCLECGHLLYQGGEVRDLDTGRVMPGESTPRTTDIDVLCWDDALREMARDFNSYQFAACRRAIAYWQQRQPKLAAHLRWLDVLTQAYAQWDLFDHVPAAALFTCEAKLRPANCADVELLTANAAAVAKIADVFAGSSNRAQRDEDFLAHPESVLLLADLFANAERRALEGKYDDALARLYRLTEMVAQYRLRTHYGLPSYAVPVDYLTAHGLDPFNYNRAAARNGTIKVGRRQNYQLLADLGDSKLTAYCHDKAFEDLLDKRNVSILAHGFCPIAPEIYGDLCPRVKYLCEIVDGNFAAHLQQCTFLTL